MVLNLKQIVHIAVLTALLFAVKVTFGAISGVEFVTGLILLYAVFLRYVYSMYITVAFVFLCGIFYGFGAWWFMYIFIWPTEVTITYLNRRWLTKNNVLFGLWASFWGFSIILWYSISNFLVGGLPLVIEHFASGFVFNVTEGVCNFIFSIVLFYPIRNVFHKFLAQHKGWGYNLSPQKGYTSTK